MRLRPRLATVVRALAILLFSIDPASAAWVETQIKAHTAIVDVERSGVGSIQHQIVLGVRGGPLRDFELQGIDPDAEPSEEASVVAMGRSSRSAPIPLVLSRGDDGSLKLEIQNEKGLRTGTYAFTFSYRTNLLSRDRIRRRGTAAEIEWVSPRFADGIDVAKVIFRLPEGPITPMIPNGMDSDDAALLGSAFLSSVRHQNGKVEVEIVRPHVARGEPAVWRVQTSPKCFDGLGDPSASVGRPAATPGVMERPTERLGWIGALLAIALGYALLVALKWSLHRRDCEAAGAEALAWVRMPVGARAALAGAFVAGAVAFGALGDHPTLAAALLLPASALAALRPCRVRTPPRGPGQWLVLTDADAFTAKTRVTRGRFLDAGALAGASLLGALLTAALLGGLALAERSPYHALALGLSVSALLPIFGTGRSAQLPFDRARGPARLLSELARRLRQRSGVKAVAWARIPDGCREPDELRLLVRAPRPREGLLAIEVGVEQHASAAGFVALPFVIVRVRAESEAQAVYSAGTRWQRGRRSDERIAILRPALPALPHVLALVDTIVDQGSVAPRTSSRKTRGAGESTAKVAVRSPAHAT
jgi:hypothetical protein